MINAEVEAVRSAVSALNAGDVEGYLSAFAPDAERWISGIDQPLSLPDVREQLQALVAALDSFVLEEQLAFGSDGHVFARWLLRGTHVGTFLGIAGTGRSIEVQNVEVYSFQGPAIRTSWVYGDPLVLLKELEVPA